MENRRKLHSNMNRRKTTEEFIEEFKSKFPNSNLDFRTTYYLGGNTKTTVICPTHGIFVIQPFNLLNTGKCPKCSKIESALASRLTNEEFLARAVKKHGDLYDYSLVNYTTCKDNIIIICKIHGSFEQNPGNHLHGNGCSICNKKKANDLRRRTNDEVEKCSRNIHGDKYDYSLVDYINHDKKIKIICPIHGMFEQSLSKHLEGFGCKKCSHEKNKQNYTLSQEEFLERATKVHNGYYNYSKSVYEAWSKKIEIICKYHGSFWQYAGHHILGRGCLECANVYNLSFGGEPLENFDRDVKIPCNVYLIKLSNYDEVFYKVGISKDLKRRFSYFERIYKVEVIKIFSSDLLTCIGLERSCLRGRKKYKPKIHFWGSTECFKEGFTDFFISLTENILPPRKLDLSLL